MNKTTTAVVLVSACAGYAAGHFLVTGQGTGAGHTAFSGFGSGVRAEQKSANPVRRQDEVGKGSGGGLHPEAAPSGEALAARLRAALLLEGLDPSFARDLAEADTKGFPALLEKMQALPDIRAKSRLTELLMARWVMLDAAGGAAFFHDKKDEPNLSRLLGQWQRQDFPAAVAKAEEYGPAYLRRTLRDKGMHDPAGLMSWLTERPELNPLTLFNSGAEDSVKVLMRLAEADPQKMLAWARLAPQEPANKGVEVSYPEFARQFARLLAKTQPDEALAWARSIPDSSRSLEAVAGVAETLAASQPERALALLASLPAVWEDGWQYSILGAVDVSSPDKAKALAETLPKGGSLRRWLLQNTLSGLFEKDPAGAFVFADSLGQGEGVADWGYPPAQAMTPEGARLLLEAATGAKDSAFRDTAVKQSLLTWMEKDSESLAAWLKGKLDTPMLAAARESLQGGLAMQSILYGKADPALLEEIGLPPEAMVKSLRNIDPARAAEILQTMPAPEPAMVSDITLRMGRTEALAMADKMQSPEAQAAVWKTVTAMWVQQDSRRTSEWIATLPAGMGRDTAVLAMTSEIQKSDPDLAWGWALSMTDAQLKAEALGEAARAWNRRDAGSVQQALTDPRLTTAEREIVQTKLKAGPYD